MFAASYQQFSSFPRVVQKKGIMGNTSDRVAADRHGAKAHRSDSSGHKDHEPGGKMVDSTDDPNIFNTHGPESKVLLLDTTLGAPTAIFREGLLTQATVGYVSCVPDLWREGIHPRSGRSGEDWSPGSAHGDSLGWRREGGLHIGIL